MQLAENIIIDQVMQDRIDAQTMNLSDYLLLALAEFTAGLFPCAITYIGAQQQAVELPAVFVDYYSLTNQQKLDDVSQYEFGFVLQYVPVDRNSTAELSGAIFTILANVYRLPSPVGEFVCYNKSSDITDGMANVTGIVRTLEQTIFDYALIQIADKEVHT